MGILLNVLQCVCMQQQHSNTMPDTKDWLGVQVTVDGAELITMPGTLADHYQQLGGAVQLMGKPDPIIYTAAQDMIRDIPSSQWLAVGDSLQHDIAG